MSTRSTDAARSRTDPAGAPRIGRLDPPPGSGAQARCACARCGAHLLAIELAPGRYEGICQVCGADEVRPVR